jgi:hypothetical protein
MGSGSQRGRGNREEPAAEPLGDLLGQLRFLPAVRLNVLWAAAAGSVTARHTRVRGAAGDVLLVAVDSQEWAEQVLAMAGQLVERLRELGLNWVRALEVEVRGSTPPRPVEARLAPASAERVRQARLAVQAVQSPGVRQALERLVLHAEPPEAERPDERTPSSKEGFR